MASNLALSKERHALLISRLKDHKIVAPDVFVSNAHKRNHEFVNLFNATENGELIYCNNIAALFIALDTAYIHADWRVFIDSSKDSLVGSGPTKSW